MRLVAVTKISQDDINMYGHLCGRLSKVRGPRSKISIMSKLRLDAAFCALYYIVAIYLYYS